MEANIVYLGVFCKLISGVSIIADDAEFFIRH